MPAAAALNCSSPPGMTYGARTVKTHALRRRKKQPRNSLTASSQIGRIHVYTFLWQSWLLRRDTYHLNTPSSFPPIPFSHLQI